MSHLFLGSKGERDGTREREMGWRERDGTKGERDGMEGERAKGLKEGGKRLVNVWEKEEARRGMESPHNPT